MRPWSLTTALAAVEPDVWSTTPFAAIGLVQSAADGRVHFDIRTPVAASANRLRPEDLPTALHAPIAAPMCTHLQPGSNPARAIDRLTAHFDLDSMALVPLGSHGQSPAIWAALADSRAIADDEMEALHAIGERVVALCEAGEPDATRQHRLARFDRMSGILPTLAAALDVRDVFGTLSSLTRDILPHDSAIIATFEDGGRRVRLHALSAPPGWTVPELMDSPYPDALHFGWEFALHHDLSRNPIERHLIARFGIRSAMRLPIELDGRIAGLLSFNTFTPNAYTQADVVVARRVADYVAVALSHRRLADDAREAAAVRERAAHLEMLDGLLQTFAGVLDLREVFTRVSQVSDKVIAHDAMSVSMPSEDKTRLTIHVATGALGHLPTPFDQPTPAPRLLNEHWDYELVDDLQSHPEFHSTMASQSGMVAMLSLPVWLEARLVASVNFFSRTKGKFTRDDVVVGRRIADHIALALSHQRLAEEQRRAVELRARAANLELLDQLLATLTDGTELRELFDRVSALTKKVIPHDVMTVPVLLPDGVHARVYASSGLDPASLPPIVPVPTLFVRDRNWEYDIVADATLAEDPELRGVAARGFRSVLRVPIRIGGAFAAGLALVARPPNLYSLADVLAARRIADRFALCLSRERQVEAAKRADEASERAKRLEARVRALTDELDARTGYRRVVGQSAPWKQVLTQATQVAATDTTVLLLGESGTGKEVVARFLHRASSRPSGRFVALNCAALPEQLLEAELFGYERGAFTGATQTKPGQLEQASGGTLFLDEVGEMSPQVQAKFLRVLQEKEFQRLGGTRVLKTDARIVAATNRDLQQAIAQGAFREDLFYRLHVFAIHLPALRDRVDDVLPLAEAFLAEYGASLGRPPAGISRDARDKLRAHRWPGNVRELRNILERAAILCEGGLITSEHLALEAVPTPRHAVEAVVATAAPGRHAAPAVPSLPASAGDLQDMERVLVEQALTAARFNKSKAAKALGMTRAQLYVRMKRYGLE
jgi:transcriptional regulator with GAF, ATPase, and Fis domain